MNLNGPGKYDDECTLLREVTGGQGVIVMVFGGRKGNGFSCQVTADVLMRLPTMLRQMADDIEGERQ